MNLQRPWTLCEGDLIHELRLPKIELPKKIFKSGVFSAGWWSRVMLVDSVAPANHGETKSTEHR